MSLVIIDAHTPSITIHVVYIKKHSRCGGVANKHVLLFGLRDSDNITSILRFLLGYYLTPLVHFTKIQKFERSRYLSPRAPDKEIRNGCHSLLIFLKKMSLSNLLEEITSESFL